MKTKLLIVLMAAALMLTISGTTQAVSLRSGPLLFKTYNWEVGTTYLGGVNGTTYFRDAGASYYDNNQNLISYTGAADQGLFSDLTIVKDPSLRDVSLGDTYNEDTWGLLEVRQLEMGQVGGDGSVGNNIGPKTPADIYWNAGENDTYLRGVLWGSQDQAVVWESANLKRIYATGMQGSLYEMDTPTYNPQNDGPPPPTDPPAGPTPWLRDKTKPDEFNPNPAQWDPWIEDTGDNLLLKMTGSWFRYSGDLDDPDGTNVPAGETNIYLDVTGGRWAPYVQNWWDDPASPDGSGRSDIWQTWNIGDPTPYANGWVGSEDSGRAYILIPEPITMLGVFLGVSSLTGYLRKRRMA